METLLLLSALLQGTYYAAKLGLLVRDESPLLFLKKTHELTSGDSVGTTLAF